MAADIFAGIISDHDPAVPVFGFVDHNTYRLLDPPEVVIRELLVEVIVDNSHIYLWPSGHEVPPDHARGLPFVQAHSLHEILRRFRLRDLCKQNKVFELVRNDSK